MTALIKRLERRITPKQEEKWRDIFTKQSAYVGNGIYKVGNRLSTDTRELFLMFVADCEKMKFKLD